VQKLYTVDDSLKRLKLSSTQVALFVWLISHQPVVLSSQNKPATNNQPAVLFSQNKSAPAISHQPNEQAVYNREPTRKGMHQTVGITESV
jgi:hypothetical protein